MITKYCNFLYECEWMLEIPLWLVFDVITVFLLFDSVELTSNLDSLETIGFSCWEFLRNNDEGLSQIAIMLFKKRKLRYKTRFCEMKIAYMEIVLTNFKFTIKPNW